MQAASACPSFLAECSSSRTVSRYCRRVPSPRGPWLLAWSTGHVDSRDWRLSSLVRKLRGRFRVPAQTQQRLLWYERNHRPPDLPTDACGRLGRGQLQLFVLPGRHHQVANANRRDLGHFEDRAAHILDGWKSIMASARPKRTVQGLRDYGWTFGAELCAHFCRVRGSARMVCLN